VLPDPAAVAVGMAEAPRDGRRMMALACSTGSRQSEILTVRRADAAGDKLALVGKRRTIRLDAQAQALIESLPAPPDDCPFFLA